MRCSGRLLAAVAVLGLAASLGVFAPAAYAAGSTTVHLDTGFTNNPVGLGIVGASTAGTLVARTGGLSVTLVPGSQSLYSGSTVTPLPSTFTGFRNGSGLVGTFATSADYSGAGQHVAFYDSSNGSTGTSLLPDQSRFLAGGPHGWVEYDGALGKVVYGQPTGTGPNAPTTRTPLVSIAGPNEYVDIQAAANSSGVVLSAACQSTTCTAPALQYVDFATKTATTLADPSLAIGARQAVTSTFRSGATALTCLSASTCLVIDGVGGLSTTTDATSATPTWTLVTIDAGQQLLDLSCPSATLCVAVDGAGQALTSTNPTGGAGAWSAPATVDSTGLPGLACPTTTLCLALDYSNNLISTTDPTAGVWSSPEPVPVQSASALDCPTTALCVAVDSLGEAVTSLTPTVASSWTARSISNSGQLFDVACPSENRCVAVDAAGEVLTTTTPTGSWSTSPSVTGSGALLAVTCLSTSSCLATGEDNNAYAFDVSTPGAPTSSSLPLSFATELACSGATCTAADTSGAASVSTDFGATWGAAVPATSLAHNGLASIVCPSLTTCLASDNAGQLTATKDSGSTWSTPFAPPLSSPVIACATATACLAADFNGQAISTADPASGTWSAPAPTGLSISLLQCPSLSLCVGVGQDSNDGQLKSVVSSNAFDSSPAWSAPTTLVTTVGTGARAMSCPSTALCLVGDSDGNVEKTTSPATNAWSSPAAVGPAGEIAAVSCASATSCDVVKQGELFTSSNASTWTPQGTLPVGPQTGQLSCPTTTLCVAVDGAGRVAVTATPLGSADAWSPPTVGSSGFSVVACVAGTVTCTLGDYVGRVARATDASQLGGRATSAVAVDEAGDVGVLSNGSNGPPTKLDLLRLSTSSPTVTSKLAVPTCAAQLVVTAARSAWNCNGALSYAAADGTGGIAALPGSALASSAPLGSNGTSVTFVRTDSVAADGVYALADGSTSPTLVVAGDADPVALRNLAVSPGRVAYTDDATDAARNPGDPWGTWSRTLTNAADGLTAGTATLVAHSASGPTLAISGTRSLVLDDNDGITRVTKGVPTGTASVLSTTDQPRGLSGTRALVRDGDYAVVVVDTVTHTRTVLAGSSTWTSATLSGRYLGYMTDTAAVHRRDLTTGADVLVLAGPTLAAGDYLSHAGGVSVAGFGIAWWYETSGVGNFHKSLSSGYVAAVAPSGAQAVVPITLDEGDLAPQVLISTQDVVYSKGTQVHAIALPAGADTTTTATLPTYSKYRFTSLALDRNVLAYEGADGYAHALQLTPQPDPPAVLTASAPRTFTYGAGRTFVPDVVTSAPLTSCSFAITQGATLLRTLPCATASMPFGEAEATWPGTNAAGATVAQGDYTWTLTAAGVDGLLKASDLGTSATTGTVTVAAATKAVATAPSYTGGPFVVTFDHNAYGANGANVRLLPATSAVVVGSTLTCYSGGGTAAPCAGPFRSVRVTPSPALVPGASYRVQVNPTGVASVVDVSKAGVIPLVSAGVRIRTSDDASFGNSWGTVADAHAIGGSFAREYRAGATFRTVLTGTSIRYWYVRGPDAGKVRVTIDGVVKDAALDLYAGARTTRAYRSYTGLTNTRHTLVVTVLGQRRTGATGTYATVDAVSTGTSGCTSTAGCSYTPGGYRWATGAFTPGALGGRVSGSDVAGATATRTFFGTGFDLVRLVGPGQGRFRLYIDGAAVAIVNDYATRNGLAAVTRTGLRSGTHTMTVQVLHQTGRAGTPAFAVTLDRLVAR